MTTITIPQDNSFGVYNEELKKWWDPKKGWSDHLTVWKKRSFHTLLTYTNLTSETRKFSRGVVKVVDIFTGEDVSSLHVKAFDEVYKVR